MADSNSPTWSRRSQPESSFNPLNISGLAAWWDASDSSTITIDTGVSQWNDKSGNSRNATQGTGSAQPAIQTAAQNGKDGLRFDGSNDVLNFTTSALSAFTTFMVHNTLSGKNTGVFSWRIAGQAGFEVYNVSYATVHTSNLIIYNGSAEVTPTQKETSGESYPTATRLYSWDSNYVYRKNGSVINTTTGTFSMGNKANGLIGRGYTGGGAYYHADIFEILIYDSVLSDSDKARVESYLNTKWALY